MLFKLIKRILFQPFIARVITKTLLRVHQLSYRYLGPFAVASEGGIHPKHRIMKYHQFFIDNLEEGNSVLDIGCGNGELLMDVAKGSVVLAVGVELSKDNADLASAKMREFKNVEIIQADIWKYKDGRKFDVVILSNILEHILNRIELLDHIRKEWEPKKLLIRIPMYEREWVVPYKQEQGIEWRLDKTHKIEHTEIEIRKELKAASLKIRNITFRWGEMYIVVVPL